MNGAIFDCARDFALGKVHGIDPAQGRECLSSNGMKYTAQAMAKA